MIPSFFGKPLTTNLAFTDCYHQVLLLLCKHIYSAVLFSSMVALLTVVFDLTSKNPEHHVQLTPTWLIQQLYCILITFLVLLCQSRKYNWGRERITMMAWYLWKISSILAHEWFWDYIILVIETIFYSLIGASCCKSCTEKSFKWTNSGLFISESTFLYLFTWSVYTTADH